jgi:hypothetical protein
MDSKRFDSFTKSIGRRPAIALGLAAVLGAVDGAQGRRRRLRSQKRQCRVQGHPCEVGGQECCPVEGKVVECRVTGPGAVTRCAVAGEPDPPPVPPTPDKPGDGSGGGGDTPGKKRRRRKKKGDKGRCKDSRASGRGCAVNCQCKSNKCQRGKCCDPKGNHCRSDSECCSGRCEWVHAPNRPGNPDEDRQCA